MKRTILIGVLAALMLFAFTACENNTTTGVEQLIVTKIEVTSEAPSLFSGEDFDDSALTVVATRLDGTTFDVPASDYEFTAVTATAKEAELTKVGTVKYTGFSYDGAEPTADVEAYVYTPDKVVVEGDVASYYYTTANAATSAYDAKAYTVKLQALDTDNTTVIYERELNYVADEDSSWTATADSEYSVTVKTPAQVASANVAGKGEITFTSAIGSNLTASKTALFQLDVAQGITVAVKDDVEFIAGDTIDKTAEEANFTVTRNYLSGYTEDVDAADFALKFTVSGSDLTTYPAAGSSVTVTATVGDFEAETTIGTIANYIKSFTAEYTDEKTVKPGEKLVDEYVEITPVWACDEAKPADFEPTYTISNDATMPSTVAESGSWVFTVTLTNAESKADPAYMTVNAGATTSPAPEA